MNDDTIPMKRCTKCGEEKPATIEYFYTDTRVKSGLGLLAICIKCNLEQNREYRQKNSIRRKEYHRQYYRDNIEKRREYDRERWVRRVKAGYRRTRNIENEKKWWAQYYKRNAKKLRERNRLYQKTNPDKVRIARQRRRARLNQLPDTFTHEQWIACLEYFNHCCAVCGNQLRDLFGDVEPHADHWYPVSYEGGDNLGTTAKNMVCLCNFCNKSKCNKLPHVWLKEQFGSRRANEILARIQAYFDTLTRTPGNPPPVGRESE